MDTKQEVLPMARRRMYENCGNCIHLKVCSLRNTLIDTYVDIFVQHISGLAWVKLECMHKEVSHA